MNPITCSVLFLTLLASLPAQTLTWVKEPQMAKVNDTTWRIEFTLSALTDVAVSIVDPADSSVVRHIAGGVLGTNPPAPLLKDSLHQVLFWDGRDDFKKAAAAPDRLRLRVRAGLSTAFSNTAEGDLHRFNSLDGLATDTAGNLFVYGMATTLGARHIRMYNPDGSYCKTLYPYPPALSPEESHDYGILNWQGSARYTPKTTLSRRPRLAPNLISQDYSVNTLVHEAAYLATDVVNDRLFVIGTAMLNCMAIKSNGGLSGAESPFQLVTSPAVAPSVAQFKGALFTRFSHDGNTAYLSGFYAQNGPVFWMTSRIYAVNVLTGAARVLIEKSGATFAGIALDDSGHVFACEPNANRISVYDTSGAALTTLAMPQSPNQVEINKATGDIYVMTKGIAISIYKFANYKTGNTSPLSQKMNLVTKNINADRIFLALGKTAGKPVLWVGNHGASNASNASQGQDWDQNPEYSVWGLRDDGSEFTIIKDFGANNRIACNGFDRIAVDRKTETVFIQNSWNKIYKVENWRNPVVAVCSTTAGRLWGTDMAVGPNGLLYVREGQGYSGPLNLYTMDHRHRQIRNLIADVYSRYGGGYGERGIGVGYDGRIGVNYMEAWCDYVVSLYDSVGTMANKDFVNPLFMESGGVRFDQDNNVYVGAFYRTTGHRYPKFATPDQAYLIYTGSVIKFPPQGGSTDNTGGQNSTPVAQRKIYGALTVYPDGFAPFSGTPGGDGSCTCRSPRFDLDGYGRLFIPSALACRVAINDNNGNLIAYFGEYGNVDCRGPYSANPAPAIPLAFPVGTAATEDFVYVTDMYNNRVVQVKMNYALDNMPGLTDHSIAHEKELNPAAGLRLTACPNPFNPVTCLSIQNSNGNGRLTIYDMSGRVAARLTLNNGTAVWNAAGRPAGMYLAEYTEGGKKLTAPISLLK